MDYNFLLLSVLEEYFTKAKRYKMTLEIRPGLTIADVLKEVSNVHEFIYATSQMNPNNAQLYDDFREGMLVPLVDDILQYAEDTIGLDSDIVDMIFTKVVEDIINYNPDQQLGLVITSFARVKTFVDRVRSGLVFPKNESYNEHYVKVIRPILMSKDEVLKANIGKFSSVIEKVGEIPTINTDFRKRD